MIELMCPCGGELEERGDVRYYCQGKIVVHLDGKREWVGGSWVTPVETLDLDAEPYHCVECGMMYELNDTLLKPRPVAATLPG